MEAVAALLILSASIVAGLVALGLAAARWGVDSRPTIGEGHAR
jgi:hypothetical protein